MRQSVSHHLLTSKLVAVIRLKDLSQAVNISRSLLAAGITVQEFTLTNPDALSAISQVLAEVAEFSQGQASLGAGSVDSLRKAERSIAAGAQFIVSPILQTQVIDYCVSKDVASLPGAFSPTEIHTAWQAGADFVKVFPARSLGASYLQDILAPLPELRLVPTGGIGLDNMQQFLRAGAKAVGLGSSLFAAEALARQDWAAVTAHAATFVAKAKID